MVVTGTVCDFHTKSDASGVTFRTKFHRDPAAIRDNVSHVNNNIKIRL